MYILSIQDPDYLVFINLKNNHAPVFNMVKYNLSGVSRNFPTGFDLFDIYKKEVWVQDIDKNGIGDDEYTDGYSDLHIEIQGIVRTVSLSY